MRSLKDGMKILFFNMRPHSIIYKYIYDTIIYTTIPLKKKGNSKIKRWPQLS